MCVRRLLAIAMAMLMSSNVVRRSFGCGFLGSLCFPSAYRPVLRHGWRGGERRSRRCLLLSDFYRLLLSLACGSDELGLLACSYAVGRFRPAVCCARILWIAFVAVAGAASPWYIVLVS